MIFVKGGARENRPPPGGREKFTRKNSYGRRPNNRKLWAKRLVWEGIATVSVPAFSPLRPCAALLIQGDNAIASVGLRIRPGIRRGQTKKEEFAPAISMGATGLLYSADFQVGEYFRVSVGRAGAVAAVAPDWVDGGGRCG